MKYFIIAGEPSGDLHGSNLMKEIKKLDSKAEFCFTGGDLMLEQDSNIIVNINKMSYMGIFEVLKNLDKVSQNFRICKKAMLDFKPDAVIMVDYPGFNLRMSKFAKTNGFKVFYYISPTLWAWKKGRIKTIRKYVDKLYVILPFETEFYKQLNYSVDFVGNPVADVVYDYLEKNNSKDFKKRNDFSNKPIIALLPGSRKHEIKHLLDEMLYSADFFPDHHFVIAGAQSIKPEIYKKIIGNRTNISFVHNQTYDLLTNSHAAVVTSGTATLETALLNVPEVVVYKISKLTYSLRFLVNVKYFCIVNLILDKLAVREILQKNLKEEIKIELEKLIRDNNHRQKQLDDFKNLKSMFAKGASAKTAGLIYKTLTS